MCWEVLLRGTMWTQLKSGVLNVLIQEHTLCKFKLDLLMSQ